MTDNISSAFAVADQAALNRYALRARADACKVESEELARQAEAKQNEGADLIGLAVEEDRRYEEAVDAIVKAGMDRDFIDKQVSARVAALVKAGIEIKLPVANAKKPTKAKQKPKDSDDFLRQTKKSVDVQAGPLTEPENETSVAPVSVDREASADDATAALINAVQDASEKVFAADGADRADQAQTQE